MKPWISPISLSAPHVQLVPLSHAHHDALVEAVRDGEGFDVILMDLLMPEMDGQTATRKIRTELPEPQRSTPIIALTANGDKDELERCLASGMNESMLKPFNRNLLIKRVLSYVA